MHAGGGAPQLMLLHGFAGSGASWLPLLERLPASWVAHCPDLAGHAAASAFEIPSFDAEVDRIAATLTLTLGGVGGGAPNGAHLVGYSLGARVGLGLLARHPDRFASAVLVGVNGGLETAAERTHRWQQDDRWASLLEERGLEAFFESWATQPLFRSQQVAPAEGLADQRRIRAGLDPRALGRAMRGLSLAKMPDYRAAVADFAHRRPLELVAGELDLKFRSIASDLAATWGVAVAVVEGAGHNVLLEAPAALARIVERVVGRAGRR